LGFCFILSAVSSDILHFDSLPNEVDFVMKQEGETKLITLPNKIKTDMKMTKGLEAGHLFKFNLERSRDCCAVALSKLAQGTVAAITSHPSR
jgi:hypothetical protein